MRVDVHACPKSSRPRRRHRRHRHRPTDEGRPFDTASVASHGVLLSPVAAMPTARGSVAVWIVVGLLGVGAFASSRTGRRVARTGWSALKAALRYAARRVRGEPAPGPAELRRAFEELGPTYVKLGQLVASSQGLVPEPYCVEFRKCLDRVPPFAFDAVVATLRQDLGRDPSEVFAFIDPTPLASASIAQVHAARLHDGRDVVVKVQRPDIGAIIDADLRVLRLGAHAMRAFTRHGDLANPVAVVEDFDATIHEELDFRLEASNMAEFNRLMETENEALVAAPRALPGLTTRRVLVMERFRGKRVDDLSQLDRPADAEERLLVGLRAWLRCMLHHGFFHGDVHAGNLMVLDDGRVGFLDFGIVGRFTPERRAQVVAYLTSFALGDFRALAEAMLAMGEAERGGIDVDALSRDLQAAYEPLLSNDASPAKYADIIPTIVRTGIRHGLRMPRDFVLVVKQMLYFDRYAKLLAPDLNVFRDPRIVSVFLVPGGPMRPVVSVHPATDGPAAAGPTRGAGRIDDSREPAPYP